MVALDLFEVDVDVVDTSRTAGVCPGCGHVSEPPVTPPDWQKPWWCRPCLQAKCTSAWQACATHDTDHLVLDDNRIAAYRARIEADRESEG